MLFLERGRLQRPAASCSSPLWLGFGIVVSSVSIAVGSSIIVSLHESRSFPSGVKSRDLKIPPPSGHSAFLGAGKNTSGSEQKAPEVPPGPRVSADVPPGHRRGVFTEGVLPHCPRIG
ncbi:hypothetical protein NDU88_002730 [Pleurodeles waltl]|uniref:Uncharacterized protein n=1 Tax=Pleurodeles waltl TaxID=8319 RepID=A0AAV7VC17_PLEWA|nr:hypothetical protein NDU88_002730 [Pleurodeles waltl]